MIAHAEVAVRHFGVDGDRLPRTGHVALRRDGDPVWNVAREPAQELAPERHERRIVDGNLGPHLPLEGVLDGERDGDSLTEALIAEHRLLVMPNVLARRFGATVLRHDAIE